VLDANLTEESKMLSTTPVISLEFVHTMNELIVGSIGSIKIWKFKAKNTNRRRIEFDEIRLDIALGTLEEWVNVIHLCEPISMMYVGCDNNLYV